MARRRQEIFGCTRGDPVKTQRGPNHGGPGPWLSYRCRATLVAGRSLAAERYRRQFLTQCGRPTLSDRRALLRSTHQFVFSPPVPRPERVAEAAPASSNISHNAGRRAFWCSSGSTLVASSHGSVWSFTHPADRPRRPSSPVHVVRRQPRCHLHALCLPEPARQRQLTPRD